jgi:hypothetical protein
MLETIKEDVFQELPEIQQLAIYRIMLTMIYIWHPTIKRMPFDPMVSLHMEFVSQGKYYDPAYIYGPGIVTTSIMPWNLNNLHESDNEDSNSTWDDTDIGFYHLHQFYDY